MSHDIRVPCVVTVTNGARRSNHVLLRPRCSLACPAASRPTARHKGVAIISGYEADWVRTRNRLCLLLQYLFKKLFAWRKGESEDWDP